MCQSYTGFGNVMGNNHSSSIHIATVRGQHLPVAQPPLPSPVAFIIVSLLTFANLLVFFPFSPSEDTMPHVLPLAEMPFCSWALEVQICFGRDESFVRSYVSSYCEST